MNLRARHHQSRRRIINSDAENFEKAKSFDPCQPARTAQADMGRYFSQMHQAHLPKSSPFG